MNLATEVMTHVIVTFSGSSYFITEKQHRGLMTLGLQDTMNINGNLLKGSAIAEITSIEEYYRNHPDKRPESANYDLNSPDELNSLMNDFTPERKKRAMENIIKGFKQHFEGRPIPPQSQAVLDKMIERLSK